MAASTPRVLTNTSTGWREEFRPRRLLLGVTAGLVAGIISIILQVSFAALIFSGPLAPFVAHGIGLTLFGTAILAAVVALTSSLRGVVAVPQDSPAAILALVAAAIARSMTAAAAPDAVLYTVVAALACTSLATGAFFLGLGWFKLGSLARFVPYPVIGGFLAGTGWLLARGGVGVMADLPLQLTQLPSLFQPDQILRWLPGLLFALLLLVLLRRYKHFLIMPLMLLLALALFYAWLALTHSSIAQASAQGWLLGPFPSGSLWEPLTPSALTRVDWTVIAGQLDRVGTVLLISVVALLLNASGLELATRQDIDLNRELVSAGIGNLVAGLGGAPVGYQTLSLSTLTSRMGANNRLVGLITAALAGGVLFFGASLLSLFPKALLGGLLLFLGLSFLVEWVYDGWFKLPRVDYALVLFILVIVGAVGFLEGVAAGVAIAIILFVVKYSRISVVRHTLTGTNFHSTVDRPPSQRQLLREKGGQLDILQLEGFVFFGTAQNLLNQIRRRVDDPTLPPLRFLVLDLARVSGLDSSAASSFLRLEQLTEARSIQLVLTHAPPETRQLLEREGVGGKENTFVRFLPSLDEGVEWCEDRILAAAPRSPGEAQDTLEAQLSQAFSRPGGVDRFMGYLEKEQVGAGHTLVRQGDLSDSLYFIESGSGIVQLKFPDGRKVRLRKMHPGTIIGEVGLYMSGVRTASACTTEPSTIYSLSADAIKRMEAQDPDLAAALHKWIARLMAERLAENNNLLEALLD